MSNIKKFKDNLYCAPGVRDDGEGKGKGGKSRSGTSTCYSKDDLHLIAKRYNEHNPKKKNSFNSG